MICIFYILFHADRFEQAFINSLLSENGANSSTYYWIGLHDQDVARYRWIPHNNYEVPLTFTNWNKHQPGNQFYKIIIHYNLDHLCFHTLLSSLILSSSCSSQCWGVRCHVRWPCSGTLGGKTLPVLQGFVSVQTKR